MELAGTLHPVVIVAHLGYGATAAKRAVVAGPLGTVVTDAQLLRDDGECMVLDPPRNERVTEWGPVDYAVLAFDSAGAGRYHVEVTLGDGSTVTSESFEIADHLLQGIVVADISAYFRGMRSSGEIDRKDSHARFYGDDSGREVDAHGGWLDASGDFSKFLSHLSYTRMMSPQQIPLVAWALAQAADELRGAHGDLRTSQHPRLRDEALFGADFLVRFQDPAGFFYTAIFDALTKNLDERVINAPLQDSVRTQRWQAAYRHGGGMAIAALARAATLGDRGEATPDEYWAAAVKGFTHLEEHNREYLFDGEESAIDDYCALMAAIELTRTARLRGTDDRQFKAALERRAALLTARLRHDGAGRAYLLGDVAGRPYFHAAEPGLPIVALLLAAETDAAAAAGAREAARELLEGLVGRTDAVANPFGYPRQLVQRGAAAPQDAFFFPHENETGYWWQGENAGLASQAYAAALAARLLPEGDPLVPRLRELSDAMVGWVIGLNPFDSSMLQGRGRNTVEYSTIYRNSPGGILNGITGGYFDEDAIALLPSDVPDGNVWRWAEQWIPHSAWYLLAVCSAR